MKVSWEIVEEIKDRWHTKTGLLFALAFAALVTLSWLAGIRIGSLTWSEWIVLATVLGIVFAVWWFTRLPRVPKRKIGFGLGLDYEDDGDSQRAHSDLSNVLRDLVQTSEELRHDFHFVEFNRRLSRRLHIEQGRDDLLRRMRVHFALFGRVKKRQATNGSKYVIDLRGVVRHKPVSQDIKKALSDDFTEALPRQVVVDEANSFVVLEFAARHIDIVARYVIGLAAWISRDTAYAEQLLRDAETRANSISASLQGAPLASLKHRIRSGLRDIYHQRMIAGITKYVWVGDMDSLVLAEESIAKLRAYDGDNYRARLAAATCAVVLRSDVVSARKEIQKCKDTDDASWRYSEAFLCAYDGDLDGAYRSYRAAFQAPLLDETVPVPRAILA